MSFCKCGDGLQNLGVVGCPRLLQSVKKHIRTATFNDAGDRNSIKLADMVDGKLTDAYILGKLTAADTSERWYLTPKVYENVESSRTESSFEDFNSGTKVKIQTGVKEFMGIIPMVDSQIAAKLNAGACGSVAVFEIDAEGSIKGEMSIDGTELFPMTVAIGSYEAVEIEAVEGSAVQRIQVSFQYDKTVNEGQLRIISSDSIAVDLLKINGSLNGAIELVGVAGSNSAIVDLVISDFGYFGETIKIEGQTDTSAWSVIDADLNDLTPSIIVEDEGRYTLTYAEAVLGGGSIQFEGISTSASDQRYELSPLSVTFTDETKPVITLIGANVEGVALDSTFTDDGATALDNVDGDITGSIVVTNLVNTAIAGTYTVTYNVIDAAGNVADAVIRTVNVA